MNNVIQIFQAIGTGDGEYSNRLFNEQLQMLDDGVDHIYIDIHSDGGDLLEGFAIFDTIAGTSLRTTARIYNAFSIASIIPQACDAIEISANGWVMIHDARITGDAATSDDLRNQADLLDRFNERMVNVYAQAMGRTADEIVDLMKAETWFNADEAIAVGLAQTKIEPVMMFAKYDGDKMAMNAKRVQSATCRTGINDRDDKDLKMTTKKVAATLKELKAAFPRARAEFYVRAMDEEMTIEEATEERLLAMEEELVKAKADFDQLQADFDEVQSRNAMLEDELAQARADFDEPQSMDDDEPTRATRAAATAVPHVRRTRSTTSSARAQWDAAVEKLEASGMPRYKAVRRVAVLHPDLRRKLVDEANR